MAPTEYYNEGYHAYYWHESNPYRNGSKAATQWWAGYNLARSEIPACYVVTY